MSGTGNHHRELAHEVLEALLGIRALAQTLQLDPAHCFDRTAIALLIEREAQRAAGLIAQPDIPKNNP